MIFSEVRCICNIILYLTLTIICMIEGTDGPEAPPTFPALVFSHGLGAMRTTYSGITCDLASHGYIVASVEHRWAGFSVAALFHMAC